MSRISCFVARLSVCSLLVICARPMAAQSTDSLPFRARQWGAEFSAGNGFGSAGLLRFHSARRALVLDIGGSASHGSRSAESTTTNSSGLDLRVGERFYRPITRRVVQFATIGVGARHSNNTTSVTWLGGTAEQKERMSAAGIFGGVGAGWMVTPQLSLGAAYEGRVDYARTHLEIRGSQSNDRTEDLNQVQFSFGNVALRVTLYF
ncbi:MAG: outer membrane beta-barrel protein [Gemmatimonadaceae bacterium]|nr:outer membrane beta-barrel protein [Gemmatimonadaceae bacterium]